MALSTLIFFYYICNKILSKEINIEAQMSFSLINKQNIKNFVFLTDSPISAKWGIDEFKQFSQNKIFTSFIQSKKIHEYLEKNLKISHRSSIVIKTEDFGKLKFNNWAKDYFRVSQSIMYIILNSINKLTEEEERKLNNFVPYNLELYNVIESPIYDFKIKEIFDLFSVDARSFLKDYGYYSKEKGLISSSKGFYKRRFDLNGTTLTGLYSTPKTCMPDKGKCTIIEIWEIFAEMMNFRTRYLTYQDQYYGIAHLQPYALGPFTIADFVGPIFKISYYIYMRDTLQEDLSIKTYTIPFSKEFWLCILAWVIVLSLAHVIILILIKIFITRENLSQCHLPLHTPIYSLFNQCDWGSSPNLSMRLILITTIFIAMVITNSYTATFVSFIMVKSPKLPFSDLDTFLTDGTYKLGSIEGTYPYFYFKNSKNPQMETIYNKYLNNQNDEMGSVQDGLLRICIDKKYSFIAHSIAKYYSHKCKILRTPKPIIEGDTVFTLSNSHFRKIFETNLMTLRSAGILRRMQDEIDRIPIYIKEDKVTEVDFVRIKPVLLLFIICISISLGLFIIEFINYSAR